MPRKSKSVPESVATPDPVPTRQRARGAVGPKPAGELAAQEVARMKAGAGKGAPAKKAPARAPAKAAKAVKAKPVAPRASKAVAVVTVAAPVPVVAVGSQGGPSYGDYTQIMAELQAEHGLSEREVRFCLEYIVDDNASAAYLRAGYTTKNANVLGPRKLAEAGIKAAVTRLRAKRGEHVGFTADNALAMAAAILKADARELVEFRVGPCRFCYGDGGLYQRTAGEMGRDRAKHDALQDRRRERNKDYEAEDFDEQGGDGYDIRLQPNTECKNCGGDGRGRVVVKDTRNLSEGAAALYSSVKEGKDGVEVRMHDKIAVLEKVFKHHGLYEKDNGQQAAAAMDPAALIALSEAMDRSREQRRAVMAERVKEGFTGD